MKTAILLLILGVCCSSFAATPEPGLLFQLSGDHEFNADYAAGGDPVGPRELEALAALVGRPLAEAREALPHEAAPGVERLVGLVLQEHLGVRLRSAAPL